MNQVGIELKIRNTLNLADTITLDVLSRGSNMDAQYTCKFPCCILNLNLKKNKKTITLRGEGAIVKKTAPEMCNLAQKLLARSLKIPKGYRTSSNFQQ